MTPSTTYKKNNNFLQIASLVFTICFASIFTIAQNAEATSGAPETFADLAEKLGPTVVNIYTTQVVKSQQLPNNFFHDRDDLPEFFKRFFDTPNGPDTAPPKKQKRTSLGSGVIITEDGYIITNNHVVENAETINVRLTNFEEYDATIIGRDPKTDVALIKIEPKADLPYVAYGDSDLLRVGDWVMAIGNPFGFEQTVTAGIVSGKGRSLGSGPYENFIQTDASINPGNSGGPLFDMSGKMVGINTAIYSRSGGNIGIGFAIPVNMAGYVVEQLKSHGKVTRGWLGVMIQHVTPDLAKQFKLEHPIGALVGEVTSGSPAEKGGIKAGDVIIEYNGKEITQMSMLPAQVAQTPIGDEAKVTLIRQGKKKKITVKIAKLKEAEDEICDGSKIKTKFDLGLTIQELTPELSQSLSIEETSGLLVVDVEPNKPGAEAGLKRGDLILEVNQKPVTTIKQYKKTMRAAKKTESILFLIKRDNHTRFVAIKTK